MVKKEPLFYLAGIVVVGVAMGCAGNGSNPAPVASFDSAGTVNSSEEVAPMAIPASDDDQTVTIGGAEALVPPSEEPIAAGEPLALLEEGTNPLGEMDGDDSEALTRAPIACYLWKQGKTKKSYPGLVARTGLTRRLALSKGVWHIEMGPCFVYKAGNIENRMTMRKIQFTFRVDAQGRHSLPGVMGSWPRNGTRLTNRNYAIASVNRAFDGKKARLTVSNGSITLEKTQTFMRQGATAKAEFRDIQASQVFIVPNPRGLTLVTYNSGF